MKRTNYISLFWFLLLFIGPATSHAYIYKYTDENGVVSFTNKPDNVPQTRQHTVVIIDESTLPPLVIIPEAASVKPHRAKNSFRHWIEQPVSKSAIALGLVVVLMVFIIRIGGGGIFIRVAAKLLFIGFIGASIYSIYTAREYSSVPSVSEEPGAPHLKRISPIERAGNAAAALEKKLNEQEEVLDILTQPEDQ